MPGGGVTVPRVGKPGSRQRVVPGLYAALLERERDHHDRNRVDPRYRFTEAGQRGEPPPEKWLTPRPALLDDLEASRPVRLQGRQLRGRSLPDARLRRDQAFDWFEVHSDDTVHRCDRSERLSCPMP